MFVQRLIRHSQKWRLRFLHKQIMLYVEELMGSQSRQHVVDCCYDWTLCMTQVKIEFNKLRASDGRESRKPHKSVP